MSEEKFESSDENSEPKREFVPGTKVNESSETITIKKDTLWKYSTFVLAAILIVGAFAFFIGDGKSGTTGNVANNPPSAPTPSPTPTPTPIANVNIEGAPSKGDPNAPVVIVEYTDYQCPFCGRHYTQTYGQIISTYVDTGKVLYVAKDFPLNNIHPEAQKAAESAHCVRDQLGDDGFFEMHDKLFVNQGSLSNSNYKKWAREISGVDGNDFDECLDTGKHAGTVATGLSEGQANGIRGTPGFLINGNALSGAQPFSAFQQAIEAEL
jgi:protein-disulfide isomerase